VPCRNDRPGSPSDPYLSTGTAIGAGHPQDDDRRLRAPPHEGTVTPMALLSLLITGLLSASLALSPTPEPKPTGDGAWPLWPRPDVVRGFEPPATRFGPGHRGVDLLGHTQQAVHTSLAGTVAVAGTLAGRGVVVVDHGGIRTTYEPVTARVRVGDHVARGAVIGTLQRAASHCFPRACLHWGLRRGDAYLDPLVLVGAGPIRLLPPGATASPTSGPAPPPAAVTGEGLPLWLGLGTTSTLPHPPHAPGIPRAV
jgi:murein DD-endopeptidase MepM/ murein hydrolase activator NlpD